MKNYIYIICLILLIFSCQKEPEEFNTNTCNASIVLENTHLQSATLQNILDSYVQKAIPGISLVVNSSSEGFFFGMSGYSNLANSSNLKACNTFRVASLTKTIMATAIMQLVEKGDINLDSKISTILDSNIIEGLDKANETTIEELLNHTSGIPNYDDNKNFVVTILNEPGKKITVSDRLDFAKDLNGIPDSVIEKFDGIYSNTNYVLLQLILEKVTNQSFDQYIIENIIMPLNLNHTTFSTIQTFPDGLSTGYCDMYDYGKLRDVSLFDANRWSGEAAMISNGLDIYTFFNSLLSEQITSLQTLNLMKTKKLGLLHTDINGLEGFGHDGRGVGFSSEMWYFPEKDLTIILIVNKGRISEDQPSIEEFRNAFVDIVELHN